MVKAKIIFNDNSSMVTEINENTLLNQMKREQKKRLYICGIEFSEVKQVEILK